MDAQTVAKIAYLSRLSHQPGQDFLDKYGQELGAILEYVAQLQEVDTSSVTNLLGTSRVVTLDALAEDEPWDEGEAGRIRQNIIDNFPNRQGDLLVVPGIFEN